MGIRREALKKIIGGIFRFFSAEFVLPKNFESILNAKNFHRQEIKVMFLHQIDLKRTKRGPRI